MEIFQKIDFTKIVTIVTVLSSAISIIISKIFDSIQEFQKHKRIIKEKIIDSKLDAYKKAIKYYGTFFNYLYSSKYTFENLENYNYSKLLGESNKLYEEILKKLNGDAEFHEILLFYDFYAEEDEKIAENLKEKQKNYFEFLQSVENIENVDLDKEKKLRTEIINSLNDAITYFKNKVKTIRQELKELSD